MFLKIILSTTAYILEQYWNWELRNISATSNEYLHFISEIFQNTHGVISHFYWEDKYYFLWNGWPCILNYSSINQQTSVGDDEV